MGKDLFEGVEIKDQLERVFQHKRYCLYCHKWYETTSYFGNKCPEHKNMPDRKLIKIEKDLPF